MPRHRAVDTDICNCEHTRGSHVVAFASRRRTYCNLCNCNVYRLAPPLRWQGVVERHPNAHYQWWAHLTDTKNPTIKEFVGKFPTQDIATGKARTLALNMERLDRANGQ